MRKYVLNNCVVDFAQDTVLKPNGEEVHIKKNQSILIHVLLDIYPDYAPIDDIKTKVWGHTFISNESVTQLVKQTRSLINDDSKSIIVNQKGKGYSIANYSIHSDHDLITETSETINTLATPLPSRVTVATNRTLVASYLGASIIFWICILTILANKEPTGFTFARLPDISQSNITISNKTETTALLSYENYSCRVNTETKEAFCEKNK